MAVVSFPYNAYRAGYCEGAQCGERFEAGDLIRFYNGSSGKLILREECCGTEFAYLSVDRSEDDYDTIVEVDDD